MHERVVIISKVITGGLEPAPLLEEKFVFGDDISIVYFDIAAAIWTDCLGPQPKDVADQVNYPPNSGAFWSYADSMRIWSRVANTCYKAMLFMAVE